MPYVLIGSVKHAMCADWICQMCHVGWLDLSNMPCGLIESVRYAMWYDWVCEGCHVCWLDLSTCRVGWLDLSIMTNELTPYVSCPFWQFQFAWFLVLFQLIWKSSSSACCTPPYWCWLFVHLEWNKACVNWDPQQVEKIQEMSPHGMFIRSGQPSCWGECLV